jgi:hypothetical protein
MFNKWGQVFFAQGSQTRKYQISNENAIVNKEIFEDVGYSLQQPIIDCIWNVNDFEGSITRQILNCL